MPAVIGLANVFATQQGNVPASQLDANFTAVAGQTGTGRCVGLTGTNNSGTPTTQFDLAATAIVVRNATTGQTATLLAPGVTVNIGTAGPTANGRDQSAAFSASTFIRLYWIYNGTTVAAIASTSATGPTLPTGYTHWAYATTLLLDGSVQITVCYARGRTLTFRDRAIPLSAGTATAATAAGFGVVPAEATMAQIGVGPWTITADGSGIILGNADVRLVAAGTALVRITGQMTVGVNAVTKLSEVIAWVPNVSAQVFYINSVTTGSSPSLQISVLGFAVPNGDA